MTGILGSPAMGAVKHQRWAAIRFKNVVKYLRGWLAEADKFESWRAITNKAP